MVVISQKFVAFSEYMNFTGNVNNVQIFPYNSKGIPSPMSARGYLGRWSIMGKL